MGRREPYFGIFEWGGKFWDHVSFIRDSGEDTFFRGRLEIFEIFEWGGKFWDQVSFIRDSGEDIFFRSRFENSWSRLEMFK